jgi:ABC-type multidrug transport system fused ATPase/permease subunit
MLPRSNRLPLSEGVGGKNAAEALVLRFYNSTKDKLLIDGSKIEALNVSWLRHQIGYVGQQSILFSGIVMENMQLGKPDPSKETIIGAVKAANAHEFISRLADGYDLVNRCGQINESNPALMSRTITFGK